MTNTPLKPELHKALVEHIDKVCAVNNGWYKAHIVASAALWATGELTEGLTAELEEFPDYLTEEDISVPVSPSQYLTAALDYCGKQVTAWDKAEDKVDAFNNAYWVLPQAEAYGLDTAKAVAALVTRKPEWVEPACALLLEGEEAAFDGSWEMVLSTPELRLALKPQLLAKAKEINDTWNDGSTDPDEYEGFGKEVVALMVEAGVVAAPTEEEVAARDEAKQKAAEEERVARERHARDLAEIQAEETRREQQLNDYVNLARKNITTKGKGVLVVNEIADSTSFFSEIDIDAELQETEVENDKELSDWFKALLEAVDTNDFNSSILICFVRETGNELRKLSSKASKVVDEEYRNSSEVFYDALNDCIFDEVFANADRYKALIEENIEDIAGNFCEGNEYEPTGDEPTWLMKLLVDNGAEVG